MAKEKTLQMQLEANDLMAASMVAPEARGRSSAVNLDDDAGKVAIAAVKTMGVLNTKLAALDEVIKMVQAKFDELHKCSQEFVSEGQCSGTHEVLFKLADEMIIAKNKALAHLRSVKER